jgi:hypothetical protein
MADKNLFLSPSVTNRLNILSSQWMLIILHEQCSFVTGKQKHENCDEIINFYDVAPCIVEDK